MLVVVVVGWCRVSSCVGGVWVGGACGFSYCGFRCFRVPSCVFVVVLVGWLVDLGLFGVGSVGWTRWCACWCCWGLSCVSSRPKLLLYMLSLSEPCACQNSRIPPLLRASHSHSLFPHPPARHLPLPYSPPPLSTPRSYPQYLSFVPSNAPPPSQPLSVTHPLKPPSLKPPLLKPPFAHWVISHLCSLTHLYRFTTLPYTCARAVGLVVGSRVAR